MSLLFRFVHIIGKSAFAKPIEYNETSVIEFRCWPFDCDINFHLTTSKYGALMDLARVYMLGEMGMLFPLLRRRWMPIVKDVETTFFRSVQPFEKMQIYSRLLSWRDQHFYIEHHVMVGDRLCAASVVKGAFLRNGKTIPSEEIIALSGKEVVSPEPDEVVEALEELVRKKVRMLKP